MNKFEMFLVTRVGLMPVTIKGYVSAVKRIVRVIGENPDENSVESYVNELYQSNYSYHHKLNNVLALEKYLSFLGRPIKFARQRKPKPIIKETLTEAEVTKLIFNTRNIREKAIISLLAYSGIRNSEICNLKVSDFVFGENRVNITEGKFAKDGICQVSPDCTKIINDYLTEFPRQREEFLFTTLVKGNRMSTWDIRKLLKVISKRSKIEKRVYPHLLRHSLTANMLLRGADIVSLKNQLRHNWLESTLHYCNSIVFVDRNQYQKFAPSYC